MFIFVDQFSLLIVNFYRIAYRIIIGESKKQHQYCPVVWVWTDNICSERAWTNLKEMTWLVTNYDMLVYIVIYVTLMINIMWYLVFELCFWRTDVIWLYYGK